MTRKEFSPIRLDSVTTMRSSLFRLVVENCWYVRVAQNAAPQDIEVKDSAIQQESIFYPVGIEASKVDYMPLLNTVCGMMDLRNTMPLWCMAASEPFGVVHEQRMSGELITANLIMSQHTDGRWPELDTSALQKVREAPNDNARLERDRRRSRYSWVRLTQLAKVVGMPVEEIIKRYLSFLAAPERGLTVLEATREGVSKRCWSKSSMYGGVQVRLEGTLQTWKPNELTDRFWKSVTPDTWVRAGWATTVLRLHTLGVVPEPNRLYFP